MKNLYLENLRIKNSRTKKSFEFTRIKILFFLFHRTFSKLCTCFENCIPMKVFEGEMYYDFISDAKKLMENEPETAWFQEQVSKFNENILPVFAKIRTRFAMGYTFNIIEADQLLNFKS